MVRALALNCTLKPWPEASSTDRLAAEVLHEFAGFGVDGELMRVVDFDIKPGIEGDMGDYDEWPEIRAKIMSADILILCSPSWMGRMSSVALRVLERLDAEVGVTDAEGRPEVEGKVAVTAVVGREAGAQKIAAEIYQALAEVGFSIPSQGGTYWNGEAMSTVEYKDLDQTPARVATATATLARNAVHLAGLLRVDGYPANRALR